MPNLVGIGNSQVPTNAMLGGLAYQDSVGEINIDKIKARTSVTAKDIFVYDTRKDSDGGAWRHRTQNKSWYNEGASATRGARKEFPAVAVIVAYDYGLRIYDGDDPNLPMWMDFNGYIGSSSYLDATNPESCAAINGSVYTGGHLGSIEIRFISDDNRFRNTTRQYNKGNISERNSQKGWVVTGGSDVLVNNNINNVAMTVLPNAPIDASTGLPIPTIAVATDAGVSVIKDDGSVVDILGQGYTPTDNIVDFDHFNKLIFIESGGFPQRQSIPSADINRQSGRDRVYGGTSSSVPAILGTATNIVPDFHGFVCGSTTGLTILDYDTSQSQEMVAYAAASYNTGWMHGNIRGAFLSDTDDTNVTSSELITNPGPNFSNTSGWGAGNGSLSVSSGDLLLTGSSSSTNAYMYSSAFTLTSGKNYVLFVDSNQIFTYCRIGSTTALSTSEQLNTSVTSGSNSLTFTASATGTFYLKLGMVTSYSTGSINSVILRLAESDRSVNNKGIQVYGTIIKTPVATGAELVAYSGFTSGNYLEMQTGVLGSNTSVNGPLTVMCWFKGSTNGSNSQSLVMIGPASQYQARGILLDPSGNLGWFRWNNDPMSSISVTDNQWHHCVGTLDSSSTVKLYVDGNLVYNQSIVLNTSSSTQLRIGYSSGNNAPLANGSIALVKISNSVASSDQIKKIYNDEKCLYHENAKCTLHGTSDAVTGLAFDDTNDTIHVGTSSGRSEFRGLNRINNTTTAVTTAISSSNEFVAEQ